MAIERKLASIQIISDITPIPNADMIETARVLGWEVVIKKNEFKIGDKIVYIEIDSVLPKEDIRFSFLKNCNWVIKTARFRGQISQGLILNLSVLPEGKYNIGEDVTDLLHIEKYETPIPTQMNGISDGGYPGNIPKSDETRVQILQDVLTKYKNFEFYFTEKIDGTSSSFSIIDKKFKVFGRNYSYMYSDINIFWRIANKYKIEEILRRDGRNISIKGEVISEGIQGNKYKLGINEIRLYVFDVWDVDKQKYFNIDELEGFCKKNNLLMVPILAKNVKLTDNIDKLVEMSKGNSVLNPNSKREGIVLRPMEEINNVYELGRLSFKVINPEFLLKYKE